MQRTKLFYFLLALASMLIMLLPVGIANIVLGYFWHDSPCIMCWGQRIAMMYIAGMALFIVRYGFKLRYIGSALLITGIALWQSFRHVGSHAQNDIGQGFSLAIFGIHTYFWAEVVFWCVIICFAILLFIAPSLEDFIQEMKDLKYRALSTFTKAAMIVFLVITFSNMFQAFVSSGPIIFLASGDPTRFTLNPKHIEWSTEPWSEFFNNGRKRISFLGKLDVDQPDLVTKPAKMEFINNSSSSPLQIKHKYAIDSKKVLELPVNGPISEIKYNDGKYLITTENYAMYITDRNLSKIERYLRLDPFYSVTITDLVGANYIDDENIRIMGSNKSFVTVRADDHPDSKRSFSDLYEGYDNFTIDESGRGKLKTSRSKLYYVGTAAADNKYTYLITVPNNLYKNLYVIKQLNKDAGLAAEFEPTLGSDIKLKKSRSLGELYITAADVKGGKIYAASRNFNTIIVIDPESQEIVDTLSFPASIKNIRGMTFVGNKLYVVSYQDNKNMLFVLSKKTK